MAVQFDFKKRLGSGNFGEVWLVVDTALGAERALKLIPPDKVPNPGNFFQEAQILKAVEHPNVVRVEEAGTSHDGRIYVAMEYLPRGSLDDEAKGGYVDLTRAKRIMVDVLRGLQHAHEKDVLHRDVKPANILVGGIGEGQLSDFGLAVPVGFDPSKVTAKDYQYLSHLAPELFQRRRNSVFTDIYACGMTLYRLVNGDAFLPVLPMPELRHRIRSGDFPDRSSYRDFVPTALRRLINRSLRVEPDRRFQSADDMRHSLEQIRVEKNWLERTRSDGKDWTCGWNNKCYDVVLRQVEVGNWEVVVKKGRSRKQLRRLNKYCLSGAQKAQAERHARRVLQKFVSGEAK